MPRPHYYVFLILLCVAHAAASQVQSSKDALTRILEEELAREKSAFSTVSLPPYYMAYRVNDIQTVSIHSSFGSLTQSSGNKSRILNVQVRVGDYQVDNTFPLEGNAGMNLGRTGFIDLNIPLDDNADAVKYALWQATDSQYKQALEKYKRIKSFATDTASKAACFSKEEASTYYEEPLTDFNRGFDRKAWEEKLKKYSAFFLENKHIVNAEVSLQIVYERNYFVSTEGTSVVQNFTSAYMNITAGIRAEDGEIVPLHQSYFTPALTDFPADEVISTDIKAMLTTLEKLRNAPLADPYTGPAILAAPVSGVFFHEIFGHRVEGHRLNNENDGQTFKSKIDQKVLLETIDVIFDPTAKKFENTYLNGAYKYDDEGVKGQKVTVVEKGILKTFLMSRSPLESIVRSNGHGRAAASVVPVSRQSNLIVRSSQSKTDSELRQMLIKECKKQKKEYGYLFKNVVGGFTLTGRFIPNAFNIFPTEVYRVYVSGKPDELVRGVDLIGTPLVMFAEIAATGNKAGIFTGFCGAESGFVPVSAVSPSLFVRRIETQKKVKSKMEAPLLSSPVVND